MDFKVYSKHDGGHGGLAKTGYEAFHSRFHKELDLLKSLMPTLIADPNTAIKNGKLIQALKTLLYTGFTHSKVEEKQERILSRVSSKIEKVNLQVRLPDGSSNNLNARMLYPEGKDYKSPVVLFHGLGETEKHLVHYVRDLLKANHPVLLSSYTGFCDNTGQANEVSIKASAEAMIDYLAANVNKEINIVSHSLGTTIAVPALLANMKKYPDLKVNNLILISPLRNFSLVAESAMNFVSSNLKKIWGKDTGLPEFLNKLLEFAKSHAGWNLMKGLVANHWDLENDYSQLMRNYSDRVNKVSIIHGANDNVIPKHHSKRLYGLFDSEKTELDIQESQSHFSHIENDRWPSDKILEIL